MAAASIQIAQSGALGAPGLSRKDLVLAQPVTLSNASNAGVRAWRWTMVDRPTGSTAVLSNPLAAQATFTPDVAGSYLIQLTVNEGRSGEVQRRIAAVLDEDGFRYPAAGEDDEANWDSNARGWWPDLEAILRGGTAPRTLTTVGTTLAVENTATIADLFQYTIPAGVIGAGRGLALRLGGDYLNNSGAGRTLTLTIVLNGVTLYSDVSASLAASTARRTWSLYLHLMRKSATTVAMHGQMLMGDTTAPDTGLGALDIAGASLSPAMPITTAATDPAAAWASAQSLQIRITHPVADANLGIYARSGFLSKI